MRAPEASATPTSPVMTALEVAAYFRRTTRCIRYWTTAGLLHPTRIGRSIFFSRIEVEALVVEGDPKAQSQNGACIISYNEK